MPQITFIAASGARTQVEASVGASVMRAAITHGVDGILAECGGACACATCHVLIAPHDALPPRSAMEDDMLDSTAEPRTAESRLSCQVFMTQALDGLQVHLPETQL